MGYRIMYSPEDNAKYPIPIKEAGVRKWLLGGITALVLLIALSFSEVRRTALQWLLPGDPETTSAAFGSMVEDFRAGNTFTEAVTTFCREILENAN